MLISQDLDLQVCLFVRAKQAVSAPSVIADELASKLLLMVEC
jgi:hypothetical protein